MLRNIGSNWFLMAVTGVTTFVMMPFNLHQLGSEQYGVWLVISALTAYLFLLQLGVPLASVRQMTQAITAGDTLTLNRTVTSCAALYIGLGLLVGLLGIPVLMFFERTYKVAPALQSSAHWAFILALTQTALGFIAFMPYAILSAYQAFVPKNALMATAILVRAALNVVLVLWYPNLMMLGVMMLATTAFELVLAWGYVLKKYPAVRPRLQDFRAKSINDILALSVYVFLLAVGMQMAFQTSPLVIGYAMTAADVPSFAIPNSLILILLQFLGGIASVIMPLATNLQTTGNFPELRAIYYKWTKLSLALSWCACLFLLIFGPAFLSFWIQSAYTMEAGRVLRILMASCLVWLPVRAVALPVLMGLGKVKWPTIATLLAGVLNLILSIAWVGPYGLEGVAWGTAVPNVLLAAALTYLVCRELSVPIRQYLAGTLPLATIGGLGALAALGWWHQIWHPTGLFGLGLAGILTIAVTALIWVGLVLRNDPHVAVPRLSDVMRGRLT